METLLAYLGAFIIGLILGLLGGGGSILTVPLLVYAIGINPVLATAYSLFIVGTTSAFGAFRYALDKSVAIGTGLVIAIPSFIAIYATRRYILPSIPEIVISTDSFSLHKHTFIMVLFAMVMLIASISMLRKKITAKPEIPGKTNYSLVLPYVVFVGIIMGIVGAGGGFLIIPMLVFFGGLSMKKAVGTSLFIIALNSLTGFAGDIQNIAIEWDFLLGFTMLSVFGIFAGTYLQKFTNEQQLKHGFAIFILFMAAFIMSKEIIGY